MDCIVDPSRNFINKWNMYRIMKQSGPEHFLLPQTEQLTEETFLHLIKQFGSVFVKSSASWGGKNIGRARAVNGRYIWHVQGNAAELFKSAESLCPEVLNFAAEGDFIVQQEAPLVRFGERPFDIRTHLQKDVDGQWLYAGDLIRLGGKDSVVSNIAISNGEVLPTSKVLNSLFPLSSRQEKILHALKTASFEICRVLDHYHPFLETGIDFGLDEEGNLWLIEVNTDDALGGPEKELFAQLPDQTPYHQMCERSEKVYTEWLKRMGLAYENYIMDQGTE